MLIAALLELKSRLMLPRDEDELLDLEPGEAAEELLARMLEARRYRRAADHLADAPGRRGRRALPPRAAAAGAAPRDLDDAGAVYDPRRARRGARRPAARAADARPRRTSPSRRSPSPSVWRTCARCCLRGAMTFDEAVRGADRVTVAVTLFALLELYKQGEATWTQDEPFGDIAIAAIASARRVRRRAPDGRADRARADRRGAAVPQPRPGRARGPRRGRRLRDERARVGARRAGLRVRARHHGLQLKRVAGGIALATDPVAEEAARRLLARAAHAAADARAGRDARDRRLPAARLAAGDHAHPRRRRRLGDRDAARARLHRGGRALAVRRRALPHDRRCSSSSSASTRSKALPSVAQWDPTPDEEAELRDRLLRAGEQRAGSAEA